MTHIKSLQATVFKVLLLACFFAITPAHAAPEPTSSSTSRSERASSQAEAPVSEIASSAGTATAATAAAAAATAIVLSASAAGFGQAPVSEPVQPSEPAQPTSRFSQRLIGQMRDKTSDMVLTAMKYIGVPYRRGGESEHEGFDCSGFTRRVFENSIGLLLPRRAEQQAKDNGMIKIGRNELKPGDLVFFNTMRRTFSHVGIYIGDGEFIHAPRTGSEVRVEKIDAAYWAKRFTGARRAEQLQPKVAN